MSRSMSVLISVALVVFVTSGSSARTPADAGLTQSPAAVIASPAYCLAKHDVGRMAIGVSNNGTFGTQYSFSGSADCFTGEPVPNCEYPKGSNTRYLFGAAFWIGAVVVGDTLVSIGQDGWSASDAEFHPDEPPLGNMIYRSTLNPDSPAYEGAVSGQDYIAVYTDTFTSGVRGINIDEVDPRPHRPLHIEVTQCSYAWSYSYADDFVLFDYTIKNIGSERLQHIYMGVYVDADVHSEMTGGQTGAQDDICGFVHKADAFYMPQGCPDSDLVNFAWIADNDGDLQSVPGMEVPHLTGTRIVRTPNPDSLQVSFNWWVSNADPAFDFGPQTRAKFRDLGHGGTGTPIGDRNKYHYLSNGEFDYDQAYTGTIPDDDSIWMPPNFPVEDALSRGFDTRYLLSFGPFDIDPGQEIPLAFAYVAGEDLHTDPDNMQNNLVNQYDPDAYYANLDFDALSRNAIWAGWVYDNPGVDTDSDGYAGVLDTCDLGGGDFAEIWRTGDGVPDWRAACSPAAPVFWVEPMAHALWIRWNGLVSETGVDLFSKDVDFEGYRVYLAPGDPLSGFALMASYDIEDFHKWVWDDSAMVDGRLGGWVLREPPLTLEELRCSYAPDSCSDSLWHPEDYTRQNPFWVSGTDSIFYFEKVFCNCCQFGVETPFLKRFPDATEPTREWIADTTTIPALVRDEVLTDDGYFKYYEYEYTIVNLLPHYPYWVSVTAFDYGSPVMGAAPVESPVAGNAQRAVPLATEPTCCVGLTGNVDDDPGEIIDIGDVTWLVSYLYLDGPEPECIAEADTDGDPEGVIDIGDVTWLIDYLYVHPGARPPVPCPTDGFEVGDFPDEVGFEWTYEVYDSLLGATDTVTVRIADTITMAGGRPATVWVYGFSDSVDTQYVAAAGDTVSVYPDTNVSFLVAKYIFPLEAGRNWTYNHRLGHATSTVVRADSASVPFGTFQDCFLIETDVRGVVFDDFSFYSIWLAPNAGAVWIDRYEEFNYSLLAIQRWELIGFAPPP